MSSSTPIGQILRGLRGEQSLRSAARELRVDAAYLSRVERGEQRASEALRERAAAYYEADPQQLAIAEGRLPADLLAILAAHPEAIDELRKRYGTPR
jgi:transcriptional regulator with XRE-family HTH domain